MANDIDNIHWKNHIHIVTRGQFSSHSSQYYKKGVFFPANPANPAL